ncbi:MAG: hypothetical protein AAF662_02930 [Pseudomonadota bacterium]
MSDEATWPSVFQSLGRPVFFTGLALYATVALFSYWQAPIGAPWKFLSIETTKGQITDPDATRADVAEARNEELLAELDRLATEVQRYRRLHNQAVLELKSTIRRGEDLEQEVASLQEDISALERSRMYWRQNSESMSEQISEILSDRSEQEGKLKLEKTL